MRSFGVYVYPARGSGPPYAADAPRREAWGRAINHYLKTNAHRNVETAQLKIAVEEATGQTLAGSSISGCSEQAIRMTVTYTWMSCQGGELKVSRRRSRLKDRSIPRLNSSGCGDVGITTAGGERIERIMVRPGAREYTLRGRQQAAIVQFRPRNTTYQGSQFDKPKEELSYQATHDRDMMGRVVAIAEA